VTNLARQNDMVDVIVVDDRPAEQEEIRQLLKEECGCNPNFFADYRNAYKAILEQVGHRLLINYQLGGKDLGAALLQKLQDNGLEVPTIVINCRSKERKAVSTYCARFDFVAQTVEANEIQNHVAAIRRTFTKRTPHSLIRTTGKPTVFVIHGRDVKAVGQSTETAVARFARILKVNLGVDVVVLKGEPFDGRTLIQQIEGYVKDSAIAVALFTADDIGCLKDESNFVLRVRQNVLFETGFARGYLGPRQTIIFQDRDIELPSDLGGVRTLNINDTDDQIIIALKQIFDELGIKAPMKRI
jgi:predicted nucleotide-binding protein